jgi:hypothetical protein
MNSSLLIKNKATCVSIVTSARHAKAQCDVGKYYGMEHLHFQSINDENVSEMNIYLMNEEDQNHTFLRQTLSLSFQWHYSPQRTLASSIKRPQLFLSSAFRLHLLTPSCSLASWRTASIHLLCGLPTKS